MIRKAFKMSLHPGQQAEYAPRRWPHRGRTESRFEIVIAARFAMLTP